MVFEQDSDKMVWDIEISTVYLKHWDLHHIFNRSFKILRKSSSKLKPLYDRDTKVPNHT